MWRRHLVALVSGFYLCVGNQSPSLAYYGARATEATLKFQATVEFPVSDGLSEEKVKEKAEEAIEKQVVHLMGSLRAESMRQTFPHLATLGEDRKIENLSLKASPHKDRRQAEYRFTGKIAIHASAFEMADVRADLPIVLPLSPDLIYEQSQDGKPGKNKCTEDEHNSSEDFFYFWDPDDENCPLKGNDTFLIRTQAQATRLPNTAQTWPEYDRLYGLNDERPGELRISVFLGYIRGIQNFERPDKNDYGRGVFEELKGFFRNKGFLLQECRDRFQEDISGDIVSRPGRGIDYFRRYEKWIKVGNKPLHVTVDLLLTDSSYGSEVVTFHRRWLEAIATSDVIYYDGHSGLGENLSLDSLERDYQEAPLSEEGYQIFLFNGCSSYSYYVDSYRNAKKSLRDIDIITAGLPSYPSTSFDNAKAFLEPFLDGRKPSWQRILNSLEKSNGEVETYLLGVSGDEDNQWRPKRFRNGF